MASIQELKNRVDCFQLADELGLVQPAGRGNYKSPHHEDKSPSLSIAKDGRSFKDFSAEGEDHSKGSVIDLLMWVEGIVDVSDAIRRLHELFGIPTDPPPGANRPREKMSLPELVASHCFGNTDAAKAYLVDERKLTPRVVDNAIKRKAVGFNDYRKDSVPAGEPTHGGPAVAFIVRAFNPGRVVAVDTRYLDPALNGGLKTQAIGEKYGFPYFTDRRAIERSHTVYIVESPINALTVECADLPGTSAVATRGTGNVDNIDWRFLAGKRVFICMDNDQPNEKGHCPGQAAAWLIHEKLLALNISALMVDQMMWDDFSWNDLNDIMQDKGRSEVRIRLQRLEQWMIPGRPGMRRDEEAYARKSRIYLPSQDNAQYWRFRVKEDHTTCVKKVSEDDGGDEKLEFGDVCGFRVAGLSRVTIAGATSVMTGIKDTSPNTVFSCSVQVPRHGPVLQRKVFEDDRLHNIEHWKRFGSVYAPMQFARMLNIMERAVHIGSRNAVNFVGLAWREGKAIVNEGPDCYFTDPEKQCPYHNLQFPSGPVEHAGRVIDAYQETFQNNAATQLLVWSLGGHLKSFLGFWPHMMIQADKGAGKSTLIKRLEQSIGFTMFSGQSIQTEFRLLTSISSTSHPVGWEELSARRQDVIDKAVGMLQENYQYTVTRRGSDMTEYVLAAPVLLAGEDVPVQSLLGKIIRSEMSGRKGDMIPDDLPHFPVLEWLNWLAQLSKSHVKDIYKKVLDYAREHARSAGDDDGAVRMIGNYAALITAWRLLTEFAGMHRDQGRFIQDALAEMNKHISETSGDREPWVWITEILLSEIDRGQFAFPYKFDLVDNGCADMEDKFCLMVRTRHVMDHIAHTPALRDRWNALPVKSSRVYKRQLHRDGVIYMEPVERTINGRRVSNMIALDLEVMAQYGLHASPKDEGF
ncbi:MAG: hypothetical protein GY703_09625 [Gammaproteobacteria bacterium]|nr:hypothetical protein [Gammaproteobacteria bacterium]